MRGVLLGVAVAAAAWLVLIGGLLLAGKGSAARDIAALIPNLVTLFRGLLRDPRVPRATKIWLVAALALRAVIRRAGRPVLEDHWRGKPEMLDRIVRVAGSRRRDTL